ncbi:MAG: hypothetical protein L3J53_08160 [Proteobacteria bacterium]|nr:hypothetical protein [Pseudomonadota bacterium]
MRTQKKISIWGNGLGLRLDSKVSKELNVKAGDEVFYDIKDGVLTIVPIKRKKVITEEYLIAGLNEQNCHSDLIPSLLPSEYEV